MSLPSFLSHGPSFSFSSSYARPEASFHKKNKDVRKTRTQRSRQKRHKVKLIEISKKKKEASFLKDAGNINKYIAEINESAIPTADKVSTNSHRPSRTKQAAKRP